MKIAIISDIHGNHYALQKVLDFARKEKVEKLLVLGDVCGYYYHPEKVLSLIDEWDYKFIRGNHERLLFQLVKGEIDGDYVRKRYGSGHRFALEKLSGEQIKKIVEAPDQLLVKFDNTSILMCHGSPLDKDQYLYPDTEIKVLEQCSNEDVDLILVGHSHHPFIFYGKLSTLINVGSVGQSRSIGGVASWLIINTVNKTFEVKSTPYCTDNLVSETALFDPEIQYLRDILRRNQNEG